MQQEASRALSLDMFRPLGLGVPIGMMQRRSMAIRSHSRPRFRRLEPLENSLSRDTSASLVLQLPRQSSVSVKSLPSNEFQFEIYGEEPTRNDELYRDVCALVDSHTIDSNISYSASYWQIGIPKHSSIDIRGQYVAVEFIDTAGDIRVNTTHGVLGFFRTSSNIQASAVDGGNIVWAGVRGTVALVADLSIDIALDKEDASLSLNAQSIGNVRILVPNLWDQNIETYTSDYSRLKDKTAGRLKLLNRSVADHDDKKTVSPPAVVLVSTMGSIVIDQPSPERSY